MSADEQGHELESKHPKGTGMYYTPKDMECKINIMIKGLDCKSRTNDVNDWCENCKEKYLKPIDPTSGSGAFLKDAADDLTKNPPFGVYE